MRKAEADARERVEAARAAALEEGRQQGVAEGEERALRHLEPVMARTARAIEDLALVRRRLHLEAEQDVVKLAVAIARRIVNRELSVDPDAILGMIHTALGKLDARELHSVCVHPSDAPRVRAELERLALPKRVDVTADASLERGALLFETARGVLDASIAAQFDEIERGLADAMARRSDR
jgi:flagellar assembly protein FliH